MLEPRVFRLPKAGSTRAEYEDSVACSRASRVYTASQCRPATIPENDRSLRRSAASAASFQLSAFSDQLLHQPGEHPFDFGGVISDRHEKNRRGAQKNKDLVQCARFKPIAFQAISF